MTKQYTNKFGRVITALQWHKAGDHPLVVPYGPSYPYVGMMRLSSGAAVIVRPGSYLVTTPGLQRPVVWSKTAFEKIHKEIENV